MSQNTTPAPPALAEPKPPPEVSASEAGLRYGSCESLGILRVKHGAGFVYKRRDGTRLTDAATLQRITALVRGMSRTKVLAAIVQLLERTAVRIGNEEYARTNGSVGLTTMGNRHVRRCSPDERVLLALLDATARSARRAARGRLPRAA